MTPASNRTEDEDRRRPKAFLPYVLLWAVMLAGMAFAAVMMLA
jgi:hypothetical protein